MQAAAPVGRTEGGFRVFPDTFSRREHKYLSQILNNRKRLCAGWGLNTEETKDFCGTRRAPTMAARAPHPFPVPCWASLTSLCVWLQEKAQELEKRVPRKGSGRTEFKLFCSEPSQGEERSPHNGLEVWVGKVTAHILHGKSPSGSFLTQVCRLSPSCFRSPCPLSRARRSSPSERVDLQSEFLQQAGLGGI